MDRECGQEIQAFVNGGLPGLHRLKLVLPNIFKHYCINTKEAKRRILSECSLSPAVVNSDVTFHIRRYIP